MEADNVETVPSNKRASLSTRGLPIFVPLIDGHVFRLFHLQPGQPSHPIRIEIFIVEINFHPPYEALSYVWGSVEDRVPIRCNGSPVVVTKNLHSALVRLRRSDVSRTLWVDAICINQGHLRERSHHVAFMSLIYKHAAKVIAFIGTDPHNAASDVASLVEDHRHRVANCPEGEALPVLHADDPSLSDPRWKSVAIFMDEPWFSRTWVIQEIGLAKKPIVVYGEEEFDYRAFIDLITWVKCCATQVEVRFQINWTSIHLDWHDWSLPSEAEEGIHLISVASSLKCTDPRDHIYAFLGHPVMFSESGHPFIIPDYEKDTIEVYRDLAEMALGRMQARWLSLVEHNEQSFTSGMPSWVRDWNVEMTVTTFGTWVDFWYQFSAGGRSQGDTSSDLAISVHGRRLKIRSAVIFDTVRSVIPFGWEAGTPELPNPEDLRDPSYHQNRERPHLALDRGWSAIVEDKSTELRYSDEHQDRVDTFSLTICAARTTYDYIPAETDMKRHRDNFAAYWRLRFPEKDYRQHVQILGGDPAMGDPDQFFADMRMACEGRCFIITEDGHVGLGPWIVKEGDVLCLIPGAKVPYVFREVSGVDSDAGTGGENDNVLKKYRLVGEAFLQGLMRGEVFNVIERTGQRHEDVVVV